MAKWISRFELEGQFPSDMERYADEQVEFLAQLHGNPAGVPMPGPEQNDMADAVYWAMDFSTDADFYAARAKVRRTATGWSFEDIEYLRPPFVSYMYGIPHPDDM